MRYCSVIVALIVGVSLFACGNDAANPVAPQVPPVDTVAVALIEISPTTPSVVQQSGRLSVTAAVTGADGSPLSRRSVTWTSSDPAIATVTATGPHSATVVGVAGGRVSIMATIGSVADSLGLTVVPLQAPLRAFVWSAVTGMVPLQPLPGESESIATAINDVGTIVGSSADHAVRWDPSGRAEDLGTLRGGASQANGINNKGQVIGWSLDASGARRAFLWTEAGGMVNIGTLPGDLASDALAINDNGVVVGLSSSSLGSRPFRWTIERGMEALATLAPFSGAFASAINDVGIIVGTSSFPGEGYFNSRSTLWKPDGTRDELGTCRNQNGDPDCVTTAYGVNHNADVVGRMEGNAVRWVGGGSVAVLTTLPGARFSEARGINNAGTVVGYLISDDITPMRAFLWTESGGMKDLGVLPGTTYSSASAINNVGQIVGYSR